MTTILAVFGHTFKSTFRNLKSSGIMFILPVVFMGVFGLAFGGERSIDINVGVVQENIDTVSIVDVMGSVSEESDGLEIRSEMIRNSDDLRRGVDSGEFDIGLVVTGSSPDPSTYGYEIIVPDGDVNSIINRTILTDIINPIRFGDSSNIEISVVDPNQENLSGFDYLAPGLMIYGLIILIPGIANDFTKISESNQIFRYANSKVKASEIIIGNTIFYLFIGIIQTFILYFTAVGFGYNSTGSVFLAIVPALLVVLFVVAIGLLIGGFYKKTEAATNTGTILSIILGFFSGSFIQGIGSLWEFEIFGKSYEFNQILPTTWGTEVFKEILTRGGDLSDVQGELVFLLVSGIITILIGTWVYSSRQLRFRK